jgi:type II secretory pathway component PulC
MNPPFRHTSIFFNIATAVIIIITVAVGVYMVNHNSVLPLNIEIHEHQIFKDKTEGEKFLANLSKVLKSAEEGTVTGELARRFRLAGTILSVSGSGAGEPMAIIDDRVTVTQRIVTRREEVIEGIVLAKVSAESIVLTGPDGEEEIFLENVPRPSPAIADKSEESAKAEIAGSGKQVFPNRWEFERDVLLDYYAELRDEPERLLAVFDSMEPVFVTDLDGEQRITGYVVNVVGEQDFFTSAGLSNGDIVRSVNSVLMTNRRRAEAFIASFVEGNLSTFVLEVERDGKTSKQVYMIKP